LAESVAAHDWMLEYWVLLPVQRLWVAPQRVWMAVDESEEAVLAAEVAGLDSAVLLEGDPDDGKGGIDAAMVDW